MNNKRIIVVGADHAGFRLKNALAAQLREKGYEVPESVLTVAEAKEAMLNLLGKGGEADA